MHEWTDRKGKMNMLHTFTKNESIKKNELFFQIYRMVGEGGGGGREIKCDVLSSILSHFHYKFNKFNNTGACTSMLDSINDVTKTSMKISFLA